MLLDHLTDPATILAMETTNNFYTSSPAVLLPPNLAAQQMSNGHYAEQPMSTFSTNAQTSTSTPSYAGTDPIEPIQPTPGSLAGRKRSRGDIHHEEEDYFGDESTVTATAADPDAMADDNTPARPTHVKRPSFTSRKSQRIDSTSASQDNLAQLVLPPQMREVTEEPLIDEATRTLGISWTRMDSTDTFRIRQAAYSKWIQNHYPSLSNVSVWFENTAIPCYLAEATNAYSGQKEFYILSNDLTEARLVTSDASQLVPRLQMLPALHLAAPGGCLRAESDPITATQNEINGVQAEMSGITTNGNRAEPAALLETKGPCFAHAMEMD